MARPGRSGKAVMVKAALPSLLLQLLLLLVIFLCAQQGVVVEAKAAAAKNAPAARARKEDVKFIKCGVCEEIVKQLHRQVKKKRDAIAPKKLTELDIIDITESICNIKKQEADWLLYLDIVEDGKTLKLVEQPEEGDCNTECKTIERACQEVMGDYDTDVAEFMFKGEAQRSALSKLLCKDLSKACAQKPPPVPKDREPGEPFRPKPSKDAEMAKLMRTMGDLPGAPGMEMYSREQLMSGEAGLGMGGGDDDDDDEGDEDDASDDESLLKKAVRGAKPPSQSGFLGQAQAVLGRVQAGVQTAFKSATHHYNRVYGQVHRQVTKWWQGGKKGSKKPKSKKKSSPSKASRAQKGSKSEL